ncbi:MAG: hypothetical protein EBY11_11020 [Proteobacteria bacterium]|nr:hypothetical protein [Pseudomonadota bacterium]
MPTRSRNSGRCSCRLAARPTMAELTPAEKNAISHRSRAVQAIRPVLDTWVASQPPTASLPDLPTLHSPIGSPLDPRASQGG